MNFPHIERCLNRGLVLEINASEPGSWEAILATTKGLRRYESEPQRHIVQTLIELESLLVVSGRKMSFSKHHHDTIALLVLRDIGSIIQVRKSNHLYVVTIKDFNKSLPQRGIGIEMPNLWMAMNEGISTLFAMIAASHISKTMGN